VRPHSQRDDRWTTEPPTHATIIVAEALPDTLPLTFNDRKFLRSLRIAAD